jgi:L-lactate dehydrogenase (cytochrome)
MFDFADGGAGDEVTLRDNSEAFQRFVIVPRVLVDVDDVDPSVTLFGKRLSIPILGAPTGLTGLLHVAGERALGRALTAAGTAYVLSAMASYTIEELRTSTDGPLWFQLYVWRDRGFVDELISRAEDAGFDALVVTVDVPRAGQRERDIRNSFGIPPRLTLRTCLAALSRPRWIYNFLRHPRLRIANADTAALRPSGVQLAGYINSQFDPSLTWGDLEALRERWRRPLLVKGILHPDDARRAVRSGADGIIVSNHGGRQLDHAIAALDALTPIAHAVEGEAILILDGGIRRGSDIFKALALGADACMAARPFVYGLGAAGELGVRRAIEILTAEFRLTMSLAGCPSTAEIRASTVKRRPSDDAAGSVAPQPSHVRGKTTRRTLHKDRA